MGIPIRQGRGFLDSDVRGAASVAVVSESVARRFWPGRSAVGKRLAMSEHPGAGGLDHRSSASSRMWRRTAPAAPRAEAIYQPVAQMDEPFWINHLTFVDARHAAGAERDPGDSSAVHSVDPNQPIGAIFTHGSTDQRRRRGAEVSIDGAGGVLGAGAGPRDDRGLRRAGVRGDGTDPRTRHSHGPGSRTGERWCGWSWRVRRA